VSGNCEPVETLTVDGIRLHGLRLMPTDSGPMSGLVVLTWHGVGGNFYSTHLFRDATTRLRQLGADVVWTNNRGHDGWSIGPTGPRKGCGAAFECVADCRLDAAAWESWAERHLGARPIVHWGHSLGAVKSIFAVASEGRAAVRGVIASSPPLLSFERLRQGAQSSAFLAAIELATRTAEEDPERLIKVTHPFPLWIAAGAYLDKYGPGERYDVLRLIDQITSPLLFTYGELELRQPTDAFAEVVSRLVPRCDDQQRRFREVPRANHFYAQGANRLADEVIEFLEAMVID